MTRKPGSSSRHISIMVLGVGSFAHSTAQILKDAGANVCTYLTRNYGHYGPSLAGPVFTREQYPSPCVLMRELSDDNRQPAVEADQSLVTSTPTFGNRRRRRQESLISSSDPDLDPLRSDQSLVTSTPTKIDLVIPMSIDWAQAAWAEELLESGAAIFSPTGEGMKIERERDFARKLCSDFHIPFPQAHVARNRLEAEKILDGPSQELRRGKGRHTPGYVIKNPLCSPTSPIHTILCETLEDTRSWLKHIDYAEGVFLQEYLGRREAGHIALVSGGEIYPLVTNQEYKRAFAGDMGVVAGAPLGGLVERDPEDKYGLARELLRPLRPWFRAVNYHGPIQVTAVKAGQVSSLSPSREKKPETGRMPVPRWHVIEYNIRIGVTSGAMILRMLKNPAAVLLATARNEKPEIEFVRGRNFGCSVTLAGHGYPYVQVRSPQLPVEITEPPDCDVWWNEVTRTAGGQLMTTGHRIADVIGFGATLEEARAKAYANIRKIRSLASYYREDIGKSLWPPGNL
jgi:phosphoribosylamine---glycine ligase